MNIFVLHRSPILSAQMQCDKHIVKMVLETAQMLSTAHRMLDGKLDVVTANGRRRKTWVHSNDELYKATHYNHPCSVWARSSVSNYQWLFDHFVALSDEFTHRFGKVHLSFTKLEYLLSKAPSNCPDIGLTPFAICTNNVDKSDDPVDTYRRYYMTKTFEMKWTNRPQPNWYQDLLHA